MSRILLFCLVILLSFELSSQVNYTARDQVQPYEGLFRPGSNLHFTQAGQLYTDEDLANIAAGNPSEGILGAGVKTIRPSLPNRFVEQWGYDIRLSTFQHYKNIGLGDLTCFVGYPKTEYRDTHMSQGQNGAMCQSTLFKNMYEPIWDGGANGTPYNDDNYYAAYLWDVVTMYTEHVKFWEIWNEPGRDFSNSAWKDETLAGNWWMQDPPPCNYELKAPIEHYVRLLRISYEIVKTISPEDYVTIAGVGSESFLDAILRNTDNPVDGSPTAEYPFGGGAYFDCMGFHSYPDIDGTVRLYWDVNIGDFVYERHSDQAAYGMERRKTLYDEVLKSHGFGTTYPSKEWIVTEFNVPRQDFSGTSLGNEDLQINYILKTVVNAIKLDIRQIHIYSIYEDKTESAATHEFDLLGLYKNINFKGPYVDLEMNLEGIAYKTASDVLYGTRYDAAKTASMNLPSNLDGGAFVNEQGEYVYALWAKTTIDRVESASGTYSFPASFNLSTVYKKDWDYGQTDAVSSISSNGISLTQRPIFVTENQTISTPVVPFISANTTEGCAPVTVEFQDMTQPSADSWLWTFPGGTPSTSTEQHPTVVYATAGSYDVILEVTNGGSMESVTYDDYVNIEPTPNAMFSFANASAAAVTFINQSSDSNYYFWDFGDGNSSQDFNPYHVYAESGTYTVTLSAANDCTIQSVSQTVTIDLTGTGNEGNTPPNAAFGSSVQSGCAPLSIDFTDQSTNLPTNWVWTFEGGTPASSTERDPTVTYSAPGTYSVILQSGNLGGTDTEVRLSYVVIEDVPVADFTLGQVGANVNFSNLSTAADTYFWDFGDNMTSTDENPSHTYGADGSYTVSLSATNNCGTTTSIETIVVNTSGTGNGGLVPMASFSSDSQGACAPTSIQFTDNSSNAPTSWVWTFEGGNPATSSDQNPSVAYTAAGTYTVILEAGNAAGNDTEAKFSYITIEDVPSVGFSMMQDGSTAAFTNASSGASSYLWDFGDGNSSNDANPMHMYADNGTYTITLIASNNCGSTNSSQEITIDNSSSAQLPNADFSASVQSGCAPLVVDFSDLSTNLPDTWTWSFEGGTPASSNEQNPSITYSNAGTYTVILQAGNQAGMDTEVQISYITIEDVPSASFNVNQDGPDVIFDNNSIAANSYSWDFGDGNTSTDAEPSHSYADDGTYTIVLTATNDCGSVSSTSMLTVSGSQAPIAAFTSDLTSGCAPFTVQFTDLSTNMPDNWLWSFDGGEPAISNDQNPVVTFNDAGVYTIILQAGNGVGSNTVIQTDLIVVNDKPDAFFSLSQADNAITFFNSSDNATTYLWDFGDGNTSELENPFYEYADQGSFTISLSATNDCGTTVWTEEVVIDKIILPLGPVALFTSDIASGCAPMTVQFMDESTTNPTSWAWLFPGGSPASSNEQNPIVTYDTPGVYTVTLAVSNPYGNDINSQENLIIVNSDPIADFEPNEDNGKVDFENLSLYGTSFIWDFGDGNTSTETNPSHNYESPGTYNVILQVAGPCGFANTVVTIVVDNIVAVEDLDFVETFSVFPNPNKGAFNIHLKGESKEFVSVEFLNILGQTIESQKFSFRSGELNENFEINGLANGVYLIKISAGLQSEFHKLIIEN